MIIISIKIDDNKFMHIIDIVLTKLVIVNLYIYTIYLYGVWTIDSIWKKIFIPEAYFKHVYCIFSIIL